MKNSVKTVLIIRLSALGDIAMTIPVVYSVASAYPETTFLYLTKKKFSSLFLNAPSNLKILAREETELSSLHPDLVADLHNVGKSWKIDLHFLIRGVKVAMLNKERSRRKSNLRNKTVQKSFIERYKDVFSSLGFKFSLSFTSLFPHEVLSPLRLIHPALGVAPYARYASKTYPLDMMKDMVKCLVEKGLTVYLFGGGKEQVETLDVWENEIPGVFSVAGKYSLSDELKIMANLNGMLSMDSANQHLAAIAGTEVFTIWGGTGPICGFIPWQHNPEHSFIPDVECHPCSIAGTSACSRKDFACFASNPPKLIAGRISSAITKQNASS